ncbi:MAG: DUF6745 domain-containing protein, partial [Candidatus Dormibacteria bacterium]
MNDQQQIKTLTIQQKSRFPEFIERWTRIGLDCTPIDWVKFENQLALVYKCGGLKAPKEIIRCDSPLAMMKKIIAYEKKHQLNSVWISVSNSVWISVSNSVRNSIRDFVWNLSYNNICYGQYDAGYLSFYSYFREVCELKKETEQLVGLFSIAENSHWFYPAEDICFASEKPLFIKRDNLGRLHSVSSPAIQYKDGSSVYRWHGVVIPNEWRNKEPDARWLLTTKNAEQRRALLQVVGYSQAMEALGATVIHRDKDMLLSKITQDIDVEPILLLTVYCPST